MGLPHHIAISATVTLTDAFAALVATSRKLLGFTRRFAGLPVRNSGTLGGNVANWLADRRFDAAADCAGRQRGADEVSAGATARELRLEHLYTGYRQNVMAPDEVLAWIKGAICPRRFGRLPSRSQTLRDDISAVCWPSACTSTTGNPAGASTSAPAV